MFDDGWGAERGLIFNFIQSFQAFGKLLRKYCILGQINFVFEEFVGHTQYC